MRFKSLCKAAAAVTLAAAMITASGCNNEKNDNTAEITVARSGVTAQAEQQPTRPKFPVKRTTV